MRSGGDADVIVVGAGPGGSSAAAALARRGRRVLLLEAAAFPRDKVCGDVLLSKMDRTLGAIGASLDALAPDGRLLTGCALTLADGRRVTGRFRDGNGRTHECRVLPRVLFDERLARHAAACGADLRERHRLIEVSWDATRQSNILHVEHDGRPLIYDAPIVIGADGARSRVARGRGLLSSTPRIARYSVAIRTYVDWPDQPPTFDVFVHPSFPHGCGWVVPLPGGRANVGVGTFEARSRPTQAGMLAHLRRLAGHVTTIPDASDFSGWPLVSPSLGRQTIADGVLLVGDAAGFIDPFTGHGIHNAVASGVMAAAAADRALAERTTRATDAPLAGYPRAWRRAFGLDFLAGRILQRVHGNLHLLHAIAARATHDERWADRVMGLVAHAGSRSQIFSPTFLWGVVRSAA